MFLDLDCNLAKFQVWRSRPYKSLKPDNCESRNSSTGQRWRWLWTGLCHNPSWTFYFYDCALNNVYPDCSLHSFKISTLDSYYAGGCLVDDNYLNHLNCKKVRISFFNSINLVETSTSSYVWLFCAELCQCANGNSFWVSSVRLPLFLELKFSLQNRNSKGVTSLPRKQLWLA